MNYNTQSKVKALTVVIEVDISDAKLANFIEMTFSCCSSKTNYVWINQSCCCLQDACKDKSKMEAELISKYLWRRWCRNRELKQPRRRWQQKPHKFAYLTMRNSIFARFARAFFHLDILKTFSFFLRREMTCFGDMSEWWKMFNFVFLSLKRWFHFNSSIVRTHFASIRALNNWEMIAERRSFILRWRSQCRGRRA